MKIGYMDRSAEEVSAQVAQIMEEKRDGGRGLVGSVLPPMRARWGTRALWRSPGSRRRCRCLGRCPNRRIFRRTLFPENQTPAATLRPAFGFSYGFSWKDLLHSMRRRNATGSVPASVHTGGSGHNPPPTGAPEAAFTAGGRCAAEGKRKK